MSRITDAQIARFWSRVSRRENGCWIWTGNLNEGGYGQFSAGGEVLAHRFSWRLHFGEITEGASVLHDCDTPACVAPAHLWLGSQVDNQADAKAKGRCRNGTTARVLGRVHGWLSGPDLRKERRAAEVPVTEIARRMPRARQTVHNIEAAAVVKPEDVTAYRAAIASAVTARKAQQFAHAFDEVYPS